jgi:predicted nucleic-acid-binding protein
LPNVTVEDNVCVRYALQWYEADLDFADALHVASGSKARRFATFDDKLVKRAKKLPAVEVVSLRSEQA